MATTKKTRFDNKTKTLISEAVKAKVRATKHIEIFKAGELLFYICKDGSLRLYTAMQVNKDSDGYIKLLVSPISRDGSIERNKFETTANKLMRLWIQIGDKVEYSNPKRKAPLNYHKGYVEKITFDTDLQQLEVYIKGEDDNYKQSTRIFVGDELNHINFVS